jgi:hypothetical protein
MSQGGRKGGGGQRGRKIPLESAAPTVSNDEFLNGFILKQHSLSTVPPKQALYLLSQPLSPFDFNYFFQIGPHPIGEGDQELEKRLV